MNWEVLSSSNQLAALIDQSKDKPVVLFKHSTRCSISSMVLSRLERSWKEEETQGLLPVYLDLIQYRELSNQIAHDLGIDHESPQLIIVHDGKAVYDTSHTGINYPEILEVTGRLVG